MFRSIAILSFLLIFALGCDKNEPLENCPAEAIILDQFVQPTGEEVIITNNGEFFQVVDGSCELAGVYFDENFRQESYLENSDGIFLIADEDLIEVKNEWIENFESYDDFLTLFLLTIADADRIWNTMTLQSPSTPTVAEYVALRKCIFDETCDFIDNKIELSDDPTGIPNQCLKFTTIAPTPDMVTAKSSIQSLQQFFEKGDDLWFEGRFFIENALPFSLIDFENRFFEGSPGPRIVISNSKLAVENKFGAKDIFRHQKDLEVSMEKWFTIKLHFKFDNTENGLIELWQDGEELLSVNGKNLPTINSIQNSLEIGLTATDNNGGLYIDDIRISKEPF